MDTKEVIKSQYQAALKVLEQAIVNCHDSMWDHPDQINKFWHTVFHTLFYTHLYLQPTEDDFTAWTKHEEKFISLEGAPPPGDRANDIREPYNKEEMLEYFELCREEVNKQILTVNLDTVSGFYWLPFNKLELQFYNIRHIQHHTGELYNRLEVLENVDLGWVGMNPT